MKKIHFIAIGGAAMHNLALALHNKGFVITGSDDEIFDPAKSRLAEADLLPQKPGWFPEKISNELDAVILGMHARKDNPELIRAQELKLKVYSYPEFLYEQTKDKIRIAIGGSHGKTTITSMIMHVLKANDIVFDYMVGSQVEGFETMVFLNEKSKIAVFEGDEYLSSPIDLRPKFHLYKPHIGVINGIAWDHINVFPTFENYKEQFRLFIECIQPGGELMYYSGDDEVSNLVNRNQRADIKTTSYKAHSYSVINDRVFINTGENKKIPLNIFGKHNMQNMAAAMNVCRSIGITQKQFYEAISSFKGSKKRLEPVYKSLDVEVFLDFAHAPSKVIATVDAVREQYAGSKLIALFELHTFSSLTKEFLVGYKDSLKKADLAVVYYNPMVIEHKKLPGISKQEVKMAFHQNDLIVINDTSEIKSLLPKEYKTGKRIVLCMSSGNFGGKKIEELVQLFY